MSNYLRDILGAGSQTDSNSQPLPLIAADIPNIPGGTGANKGFWEFQLRDKEGNWAEMGGDFTFELEIEGLGRITGHGKLMAVIRPGVGLLRVTNHPVLGDRDIEVTSDDISAAEAIIPDADYERVTGKKLGPQGETASDDSQLKDSITGDEALQKIYGQMGLHAKKSGRFAVGRSVKDVRAAAKEAYKPVYEKLKVEYPELMVDFPDYESYWNYASQSLAAGVFTRWADSVDDIPELTKASNKIYAREILGLKEDGIIEFYRNSVNHKSSPELAGAGYASLDRRMAWDYNSYLIKYADNGLNENDGRYIVKAKPDEVTGLLGISGAEDEYGVVIGLDVTSQPGRTTRVGDLEMQQVAPWSDDIQTFDRSGGGSPFRRVSPASQFEVFATENPLPGDGYGGFYEAYDLDKESRPIPTKWDEMFGEGSFDSLNGDYPSYRSMQSLFVDAGDGKVGLDMMELDQISSRDSQNPEANDTYDKTLKMLSVIQELSGKTFMVHRGHNPNDPRIPEKPAVSNSLNNLGINFESATMDADGTRLPTPGAFTGKFQEIVAGAKDWKEVQERLKGQTITYFDFETTGISDYDGDGIKNDPIQLGAVQVKDGEIVKRFNLYVNPGSKLSYWSATKLQRDVVDENGKRVVDEEGKPASTLVTPDWLEQQVSPEDAVRQFIEFMGPDALVGGQNVPFDLEILRRMANSAGVELDIAGTIDSKDLASLLPKYDPEKGIDGPKQVDKDTGNLRPSSSLGPVANFLGFEPANWHSADGDAEDSYNLVSKIIDRAANEDSKDLRLLDFPEMEKQYKKKMDEFKAVVSKDNPITERQKKALTEFADSKYPDIASVAKEALSVKQTRGQAAQLLEKINEVNDIRSRTEEKTKEEKTPEPVEVSAPGVVEESTATSVRTMEDLPNSKLYSEDRYVPIADIEFEIDGEELDSEEFEAVEDYMGAYYTEINAALLANPSMSGEEMLKYVDPSTIQVTEPFTNDVYQLDTPKAFELISKLDSTFAKSSLKNNQVLYRGIHISPEERDLLLSLNPGDVLIENRFMSTTTQLEVANEYAYRVNGAGGNTSSIDGNVPVIFRINASSGTPAFGSDDIVASSSIDHLVLGRNIPLTIEGMSKTSKGVLVIDVKTSKPEPAEISTPDAVKESASQAGKRLTSSDGSSEEFWNTDKTPGELKAEASAEISQGMLDNGISIEQLDALNQSLVSMYDTGTNDPYVSEWEGSAPYGQIMITDGAIGFVPLARAIVRLGLTEEELKSLSSTGDYNFTMNDVKKILEKANSSEDALSEFKLYQELTDSERAKMAVSTLIKDWASSSNGNNARSLAIQEIAEIVFDTKNARDWKSPPKTRDEIEKIKKEYGGVLSAFLQAQYEQTQKRFKEAGITEVVLYRGIEDGALGRTLSDNELTEVDVQSRPLSSWSTSDGHAYWFATGGYDSEATDEHAFDPETDHRGAVMLRRVVPVEQILSSSFTGVGSYDEKEMVVIGGEMQAEAVGAVKENNLIQVMREREGSTWNPLTGLETPEEKQERIEPGFENWNRAVKEIFENWDNDLVGDIDNSSGNAGNTLQANFIQKAGFNEKPTVLSQEEFDAVEGETIYRGHQSTSFMNSYIDSKLQFAGEGYFGNGTYTSNRRDTAEAYAGSSGPDASTKDEIDERILEMKLLPDANVLSFEEVPDLREWADQKTREFLEGYEKSGANPAEMQDAEWRLFNEADYTNIAIMLGIDAIRFRVPLTDKDEYYTIILNRGKVAINGKSRIK